MLMCTSRFHAVLFDGQSATFKWPQTTD